MDDNVFDQACTTTKGKNGEVMVCVFPDDPSSVVLIDSNSVSDANSPASAIKSLVETYGVRDPNEINRIATFISQRFRSVVEDYTNLFKSIFVPR